MLFERIARNIDQSYSTSNIVPFLVQWKKWYNIVPNIGRILEEYWILEVYCTNVGPLRTSLRFFCHDDER